MKKSPFLVLFVCLGLTAPAQAGLSPQHPIVFQDLRFFLDDVRPSLALLEETLRTDMLGLRTQFKWAPQKRWVKYASGEVREVALAHWNFQSILWAPFFAATVWTPFTAVMDLVMATLDNDWEFMFTTATWALTLQTLEHQRQNLFSEAVRLNIVFVADVLALLEGQTLSDAQIDANMNRTFMGLTLKFFDIHYLFAGMSFIQVPYLQGWQTYALEQKDQAVVVQAADGIQMGQLFFYNNIFDAFTLSTLFDLGAETVLSYLGLGIYFELFGFLKPDLALSYIRDLARFSADSRGDLKITDWLYFHWNWQIPLNVWKPLNDLRVGASLIPFRPVVLRGDFITYYRGDEPKYGYFIEFGLYWDLSTRVIIGVSRNAIDVTKRLPFSEDVDVFHVRAEIGMDRNFDGQMRVRPLDLLGFRRDP